MSLFPFYVQQHNKSVFLDRNYLLTLLAQTRSVEGIDFNNIGLNDTETNL